MPDAPPDAERSLLRRSWHWFLLGAVLLLLVVWVTLFDTYSIQKRLRFRQHHTALVAKNDSLRHRIGDLQRKLQHPPADSTIERIAREEYGMRRPGETVYQVENTTEPY